MSHLSGKLVQLLCLIAICITNAASLEKPKCNNTTNTDFLFADVTFSSANISWLEPSSDLIQNSSSIVGYAVKYEGKYRLFPSFANEVYVSSDEPMWLEFTKLSPWPTQYQVCLKIDYEEDGNIKRVNGKHGCAVLCTKLNHFDYFAITAISSGGMILFLLLIGFICDVKCKDIYNLSTNEVVELREVKKLHVRKRKQRKVGYTDLAA